MIKVIQADITTLAVDAIVNAANELMLGGGGVDGAIHDAAGEELFNVCLKVPEVRPGVRCPTGEARITPGFRLPAKFVIHTVGPVYYGGQRGEAEKLAACYRNSLALAAENGCHTVAFPCISTGVYGYPLEDAAKIAIREVSAFLETHPEMEVTFCCFSKWDVEIYEKLLTKSEKLNAQKGKIYFMKFVLEKIHRGVSEEDLIADLQSVAKKIGGMVKSNAELGI